MLICAALLVQTDEHDPNSTVVVPCHRHGDGYGMLHIFKVKAKVVKEGFMNREGEFLDRYEAFEHALNCGQLPQSTRWYKEDNHECELYSEDLY